MLTRNKNGDKTLEVITAPEGDADDKKKKKRNPLNVEKKTCEQTFRLKDSLHLDYELQDRVGKADPRRRFVLSEHTHKTQISVNRIAKRLASMKYSKEVLAQAYLNLGVVGYGLKHTLKACLLLLDLQETSENQGKRLRLHKTLAIL